MKSKHTLKDAGNVFCQHINSLRAEETVAVRLEVDSPTLHCHRGPEVGDEATPHGGRLDWFTGNPLDRENERETTQVNILERICAGCTEDREIGGCIRQYESKMRGGM